MKIWINGKIEEIPGGSTVRDAVKVAGVTDHRGVAVAVDEQIVPAARWDDVILMEGQTLEVLRAVQGGAF